jgi:hypothetical protein
LLLATTRERDIDAAGGELSLEGAARERRAARLDGGLHLSLHLVAARTRSRALGSAEAAERFELLGERALLAEPAHARRLERRKIAARGNFAKRLRGKCRQVRHENEPPLS